MATTVRACSRWADRCWTDRRLNGSLISWHHCTAVVDCDLWTRRLGGIQMFHTAERPPRVDHHFFLEQTSTYGTLTRFDRAVKHSYSGNNCSMTAYAPIILWAACSLHVAPLSRLFTARSYHIEWPKYFKAFGREIRFSDKSRYWLLGLCSPH